MSLHKVAKAGLHAFHGSLNPTKFFDKGFLQKLAKEGTDSDLFDIMPENVQKVVDTVGPIALNFIPVAGPAIYAAYTAAKNFGDTGKVGSSLAKGGLAYAGNAIGGSDYGRDIFGSATLGGALEKSGFSGVANVLGDSLAKTGISQIGSGLAANAIGDAVTPYLDGPMDLTNIQAFKPSRAGQSQLPGSLSSFGGLDPTQQATNIANKGVFGGGLGGQEEDYFTNLVNRQLVDDSGKVGDIKSLAPIENSYLGQLGLGNYTNSNDLLEAISKRRQAA